MKHGTLLSIGLALVLGSTSLAGLAQSQTGYPANGLAGNLHALDLAVEGPNTCGPYAFTMVNPGTAWGTNYGAVPSYFNVQAGTGPQQLHLQFHYEISVVAPAPTYQFWIDGQFCSSCTVQLNAHVPGFSFDPNISIYTDVLTITHQAGDAWAAPNNGIREFGLRVNLFGQPNCEVRFKAVMVGTTFSNVMGEYDAPALPLYILRDPPGDGSYSTITITDGACVGTTTSVTTGSTQDSYFKARVGVAGTVPFIGLEYDIYGEIGGDYHAAQTEQANFDITTCFENTQMISTGTSGPPDDVFIGSAIRYAYGFGQVITRTDCGTVEKDAYFANGPIQVNSRYAYTESQIRNTIIPDLEDLITGLTPGTSGYRDAVSQLGVWVQTLAMNDSIKAAAVVDVVESFSGGLAEDHTYTTTTTQARSISYEATMESGFTGEFGVNIGGSGITAGGGMHFQQGYGSGQNASNTVTNTMAYHLADDDGSDQFTVKVCADPVFGTFVFTLDSAGAETSCPYEGGEQVDQPSLSVGAPGQTSMVVNEATIGSQVIFPLYVCNNSAQDRTYYLKFSSGTNTSGAIMNAFGNQLNGNDDGIELDVPAGDCLNLTNLLLTQPNVNVVDFENILLYLYSLCDPSISSSVTISAYFGTGNVAPNNYCAPPSQGDVQYGFYVDGVQLGDIENLNTGGTPPPEGYVNYTADYSTTISRNSFQLLTVTAGPAGPIRIAAWIDYDHSETYEPNEKIGETTDFNGDRQSFLDFQVPAGASLGSTRMRVRAVWVIPGVEPTPMDPCHAYQYSEVEEYGIVIDGNTPVDCLGVPNGPAFPGSMCDDGNPATVLDGYGSNCVCAGVPADCLGMAFGSALPGTPCDDSNSSTGSDVYGANCVCAGLAFDCLGVAGGTTVTGSPCDDGDAYTGNDVYDTNCTCVGQLIDCMGAIGGSDLPGAPCDDGNPLSGGDAYDANCLCAGAFATDCAGVPGGTAQPGTSCDDGNAATGNDAYGVNCACAGLAYDCAGTPGGTQTPGTPCDDGNPTSTNDTFTANCGCIGVLPNDCEGVPGGTAQPGTACDDGDANTGNDVYNAFCTCAGQLIDCDGVTGGLALPGFPCDDANASTGGDVWDNNCQCAGQLIDCIGEPGGTATIGTACDDSDADTENDTYNANCICAGTLANDCEGVLGGPAQPGTVCDDGDASTGNDVYSANCACAGEVIDCEGTIGGAMLPGTTCDDGVACTANDVRGADCVCSGTTITIGAISGATTVFGNTSNAYVVTPVANATSYNWALPNGWTTSDNSAFVIVAEANNTPGDVELCVTVMVGDCELASCITVTVDFNTDIATSNATSSDWFTVQPNPSSGVFQLIPTAGDASMTITVYDGIGRIVKAQFPVVGKRAVSLDLGEVAPGAYYLMATREGEQRAMKLIVRR
jgi:hypothetical protein